MPKTKKKKLKCGTCGSTKQVKRYVIADNLEEPKARCKKCIDELTLEVLKLMAKEEMNSELLLRKYD